MTTFVIYTAHPRAPSASQEGSGFAAPAASGLSLDDSVTGTGASKSILDEYVGSTSTLKVQKFLRDMTRKDDCGRVWYASTDGGSTFIKPAD